MFSSESGTSTCKYTHLCIENPVNKFQTSEMRIPLIEVLLTLSALVSVSLPIAIVPQDPEPQPPSCLSTAHEADGYKTFMHICEVEEDTLGFKEYCFLTNGHCCIIPERTKDANFVKTDVFSLANNEYIFVGFFPAASGGVCYAFDGAHSTLPSCSFCEDSQSSCVTIKCEDNIDGDGCREGFDPPGSCCECDMFGVSGKPHYQAVDGTCKPMCNDFCNGPMTIKGCASCKEGHAGLDCCECDSEHYLEEGVCHAIKLCDVGTISCSSGVCTCEPGYTGPGCCGCDNGYHQTEEGICEESCDVGAISCSSGVCTCEPGYTGPGCCECDNGYHQTEEGICEESCDVGAISCSSGVCTCEPGYTGPGCCGCDNSHYKSEEDICEKSCDVGTISCSSGVCTCEPGYTGPGCCECDNGHHQTEEGICEESCDVGAVSCSSGVCTCEPGYTGPGCCGCDNGYHQTEGICKESCDVGAISCSSGVCTCEPGYTGPGCCECDNSHHQTEEGICEESCDVGAISCSSGVCTCEPGYTGPGCCGCDNSHYKSEEDICEGSCNVGTISCSSGVCTCEPGYTGPGCCECDNGYHQTEEGICSEEPECLENSDGDRCQEGFGPPGSCCECDVVGANGRPHYRAVDGTCKPVCNSFCTGQMTIDGCTSCKEGHAGSDCCECDSEHYLEEGVCHKSCDVGTISCSSGVCTCEPGYTGPGCCECEQGHYNPKEGVCEEACAPGVIKCSNSVCTCKIGYEGHACCDCAAGYTRAHNGTCFVPCVETCNDGVCSCNVTIVEECCESRPTRRQDIFFIIDSTTSLSRMQFCQLHHGIEQLIATMEPSNVFTGPRIGGILFPTVIGDEEAVAHDTFSLGTNCGEAISLYNTIIHAFFNYEESLDNPFHEFVRGRKSFPSIALQKLTQNILQDLELGDPLERRRIAVVLTDGNNDGDKDELIEAVDALQNVVPHMTVIAAGIKDPFVSDQSINEKMREELLVIAGGNEDNVIFEDNVQTMVIDLIEKMERAGVVSSVDAMKMRNSLESLDSLAHCTCVGSIGPPRHDNILSKTRCRSRCGNKSPKECRIPPQCKSTLSLTKRSSFSHYGEHQFQHNNIDLGVNIYKRVYSRK